MTKNELVAIVDRIYASWNQSVPAASSKTVYEAWWRILGDLTVVDVDGAIDALVARDSYMPRPGTVRRMVLLSRVAEQPPAPLEAWLLLRDMAESVHNGIYVHAGIHECLTEALNRLGGVSALSLHTNGDREAFVQIYSKIVTDWEDDLLKLP